MENNTAHAERQPLALGDYLLQVSANLAEYLGYAETVDVQLNTFTTPTKEGVSVSLSFQAHTRPPVKDVLKELFTKAGNGPQA